ncbi:hypothetical protein EXIGLDRAFT_842831 [Exidia glandulosa HHB12029]|uniref:G-protein coupled receptors family 1 profile domain-containing protein n=1 Tax=Exidia glandulosa HHB12029 TaxID=1314781 RepID=A0A165D1A9_EXIGL|nr:hypothetical protein EXIGLDRAFT_842831 [Exidia glandulosa HHB12029]
MGVAGFMITAFADILLILRLHFMFDRSRRLLILNVALYIAIVAGSIAANFLHFPSSHDYFSSSLQGSCFLKVPALLSISWLLGLGFQVYLAILALAKVREAYTRFRQLGSRVNILVLLVEGNLQYYAVIVLAYCATTALTLRAPIDQAGAYNMITVAAMGIFGPKLLRDMRRMLVQREDDITLATMTRTRHSSILFASGR